MGGPPDRMLSSGDPGDDTQRRYRYQATHAAVLALSLLDDDADIEEIFCEHHEDILVKRRCNSFIGVQVKTKAEGSPPIKATDEESVRSLQRFILLEAQFPQHFTRFVLGSSCGFWRERKNGSNLPHLLDLAGGTTNGSVPSLLTNYLKKLCPKRPAGKPKASSNGKADRSRTTDQAQETKTEDSQTELVDRAVAVLAKVHLNTLPSLGDYHASLLAMLPRIPAIGDRLYTELEALAAALVAAMLQAASLAHDSPKERYISLCLDPSSVHVEETIAGKRITRDRLLGILQMQMAHQPTLCTCNHYSLESLPRGMRVLETKMSAGGISIANINLAKDLKASAEFLLNQWLHKFGRRQAEDRYRHLRTLVLNECQEALDQVRRPDRPFGPDLLNEVRRRLRARSEAGQDGLFGFSYEHLLGMANVLTEDCSLWWSDEFDLTNGDVP